MFHIVKSTRVYDGMPYDGVSCVKAGVVAGKTYNNLQEAIDDAKKLASVNPIGFDVVDTEALFYVYLSWMSNEF